MASAVLGTHRTRPGAVPAQLSSEEAQIQRATCGQPNRSALLLQVYNDGVASHQSLQRSELLRPQVPRPLWQRASQVLVACGRHHAPAASVAELGDDQTHARHDWSDWSARLGEDAHRTQSVVVEHDACNHARCGTHAPNLTIDPEHAAMRERTARARQQLAIRHKRGDAV